jgi:plastocyanin
MAKIEEFRYGATALAFVIMAFALVYIIMVYPSERATLLNDKTVDMQTVVIENLKFVPEKMEINAGGVVTWKNSDTTKHTVSFAGFSSGILNPGDIYQHKFPDTGIYVYSCEFNPGMSGTVVVK